MNTRSAREYTMFIPAQLLRNCVSSGLVTRVTLTPLSRPRLEESIYYTGVNLLLSSFFYRCSWLLLSCVLNGILCSSKCRAKKHHCTLHCSYLRYTNPVVWNNVVRQNVNPIQYLEFLFYVLCMSFSRCSAVHSEADTAVSSCYSQRKKSLLFWNIRSSAVPFISLIRRNKWVPRVESSFLMQPSQDTSPYLLFVPLKEKWNNKYYKNVVETRNSDELLNPQFFLFHFMVLARFLFFHFSFPSWNFLR
jgi:hypothetical protein